MQWLYSLRTWSYSIVFLFEQPTMFLLGKHKSVVSIEVDISMWTVTQIILKHNTLAKPSEIRKQLALYTCLVFTRANYLLCSYSL